MKNFKTQLTWIQDSQQYLSAEDRIKRTLAGLKSTIALLEKAKETCTLAQ